MMQRKLHIEELVANRTSCDAFKDSILQISSSTDFHLIKSNNHLINHAESKEEKRLLSQCGGGGGGGGA